MKSPEDRLRKRIKNYRWARWVILGAACFHLVAAGIVYAQGKEANGVIGREDYGTFFWGDFNPNESFSGWVVLAENRYSTTMLYLGVSFFMIVMVVSNHFVLKRETELLENLERLKREQVDGGTTDTAAA